MTIYIDNDYKCHATNDGTLRKIDTDYFDGKCSAFINGYRFVPQGETWTDIYGYTYHGEMISPWQPYSHLAEAQAAYDEAKAEAQAELEDMRAALELLGVNADG